MSIRHWFLALTRRPLGGDQPGVGPGRKEVLPGSRFLRHPPRPQLEAARGQALDWLKRRGKTDPATIKAFDAMWAQTDRPLLDRVAGTFALGDARGGQAPGRGPRPVGAGPHGVPDDPQRRRSSPAFYRANLGLAYARELSNRRSSEEAPGASADQARGRGGPGRLLLPPGRGRARLAAQGRRRPLHRGRAGGRRRRSRALPDGGGADGRRHADLEGQGPGRDRPQDGQHRAPSGTGPRRAPVPRRSRRRSSPASTR